MTTLHLVKNTEAEQHAVWEAFPSWAHFMWLYFLSALSALRGALFFRFEVGGWEMWVMGAGILLTCVAVLRHWAHYELMLDRITVRNHYTGREIHSLPLSAVGEVEVRQGPVADFFGIGTVLIHARSSDRLVTLRGVKEPEEVKIRLEALAWKRRVVAARQAPGSL